MTDPENAYLIFFIIDVFSGYFLLEIYPKGVYNKPVLIKKIKIMKKRKWIDSMEKEKTTPVQEESCCCCHKKKERDAKEYKDLMNRLSRIEGQVRGVKGMLEKDAYCVDILTQVAAINAALNSFNKVLLANHIKTCVVENVRNGDDSVIDELVTTMQKLMK